MDSILEVKDLSVGFGAERVMDGVSFKLLPERIMALVGESGSGKTMTALSILDLLPGSARVEGGKVLFKGKDVFALGDEEKRSIRGSEIAMVFQEPFTALNPVLRVGEQIQETIAAHEKITSENLTKRVESLLEVVRLSRETRMRYPHELSGGMRQRVMLAMALSCDPDVLILDEPTTALDVSIQKHILDLIKEIQDERQLAILFITHDLSIVSMIADDVCVMKKGKVVEAGSKEDVLKRPEHPYTKRLIECIPRLGDKRTRLPG